MVNTPGSTVVSGAMEAIERWVGRLGEEGVFCRQVNVDYASHSAEMDPILAELEGLLSELAPQAGQIAMISTVTGSRCEGASLDGAYWCRNLRQTVRLDLALAELIGDGHTVFVEASAHPVLAMPLSAASGEHRRGGRIAAPRWRRDVRAAAQSRCAARSWRCCRLGEGRREASAQQHVASLPTYAFQRQRYWLEAEKASGDVSTMGLSSAEHPLLGAATPLAESDAFLLTGRLSLAEAGWLRDHAVFGTVLLPGTGLLELSFAAARAVGLTTVSQLTLVSPLGAAGGGRGPRSGSAGWTGGRGGPSGSEHLQPCGRCARGSVVDAACAGRAEFGGRSRGSGRDGARGVAACWRGADRSDGALRGAGGARLRLWAVVPGAS